MCKRMHFEGGADARMGSKNFRAARDISKLSSQQAHKHPQLQSLHVEALWVVCVNAGLDHILKVSTVQNLFFKKSVACFILCV